MDASNIKPGLEPRRAAVRRWRCDDDERVSQLLEKRRRTLSAASCDGEGGCPDHR